jgi:GT2 family glycosyltransferase
LSGVSVVVPSWNDNERLEQCLEALAEQTIRKELEIVVSLDGGDPLPDRISGLADLVINGPHSGAAAARNRGWRGCSGTLILFTDSDCIPSSDWAERMLCSLEEGADAVKGVYSSGGNQIIQRLAQVEFIERYVLLEKAVSIDLIDTYSAGFKRSVLEEAGGFDESFPVADSEDVDLSYRLAGMGKVLCFQPLAAVTHTHRNSWKSYFSLKVSRGVWRIKVLRSFPGKAIKDSYTPICLKIQMALSALLFPTLPSVFFSPIPISAWLLLFLASCTPLARIALRYDPRVTPLIPLFALWRGMALVYGSLRGLTRKR